MPIHRNRVSALQVARLLLSLVAWMPAVAPANAQHTNNGQNPGPSRAAGADYSGMYSFLRDGEFVQITVEDAGHVIGFISRYADPESDGGFLDHLFKSGKLEGNHLSFATETVRGLSFEFHGTVERGEGKNRSDEAFYVLDGTLEENATDKSKKISEVSLKSFPQNLASPEPEQPEKK